MFLMIQNAGVAPIEGYTLLGVSTTRDCGVSGTSGIFGTGAKQAINLLLRLRHQVHVFCGRTRLEFFTKPDVVDDGLRKKAVEKVLCRVSGTQNRTIDLGWVLDFGATDWTELPMAFREFVANAIDRTIRESHDFKPALKSGDLQVSIVQDNQLRAKDGFTRIFVNVTDAVQKWFGELPRRFLHFSQTPELVEQGLLPKAERNLNGRKTAMIYKEGVLVREIQEDDRPSVFDYNFHDHQLRLDECRNSSEYDIKSAAARLFRKATPAQLAQLMQALTSGEAYYEGLFDSYYLANTYSPPTDEEKHNWQEAWSLAAGPNAVLCDNVMTYTTDFVEKKGYHPRCTEAGSWVTAAAAYGVPTANQVLTEAESKGKQITPATPAAIEAVDIVWGWIEETNLLGGKTKPKIACFVDRMEAGNEMLGFYADGTCYFKEEIASGLNDRLLGTAVEETVHYLTGATDMSRDFQRFLIQMLVRIMR